MTGISSGENSGGEKENPRIDDWKKAPQFLKRFLGNLETNEIKKIQSQKGKTEHGQVAIKAMRIFLGGRCQSYDT